MYCNVILASANLQFQHQPAIPNTVALTNKYVLHACFYRRLTANMGGIIDKPNVRQFPMHYAVFVVPDAKRRGHNYKRASICSRGGPGCHVVVQALSRARLHRGSCYSNELFIVSILTDVE